MRIITTREFRCPIDRLWSYLVEPDRQRQWMKGLISNEPTGPGGRGAGSTFRMVIQEGGKQAGYDGEVSVFDSPYRLEVVLRGGNLPADSALRVDYRLAETGRGTRLDYAAALESKRPLNLFLRLLMPLLSLFGKLQLRRFLTTLQQLVEAPGQPA